MPDDFKTPSHMTPDEFRTLGHRMVDWIAEYMRRVESFPVRSGAQPGEVASLLPDRAPETPDGWDAIFADLERIVLPGLTHWQHPRFFAYFPANASGPAILGDLLASGLGVQGMLWSTSPACTEIETVTLDWLADLLGLPEVFTSRNGVGGGVIQGTASEAVLACMIAARDRAATTHPGCAPVVYTSEQAHSSVVKAAGLCGVGRERVRLVPVDDRLAMRPETLRAMIEADLEAGYAPAFVCATVGTTSSTAVDPVRAVGEVCRDAGCWLHIDAAFAGVAAICPEHRWMLDGAELADSVNTNPHKWLLTNFDCSTLWLRDRRPLIESMAITPEYLRNQASDAGAVIDYRDWHVPLGRRFRALKLWFVLRHYGAEGLRAYIREHVRLAQWFEAQITGDDRFELAAPRTTSLVCFRLRAADSVEADRRNRALMDAVNDSGRLFLTHTTLPALDDAGGLTGAPRLTLRLAIGAAGTREQHVREAWEAIGAAAKHV
ncbi:MAG: pyridoxal-dependent decarboxylase [Phycisphaerales bacterium]